MIEKVIKRDGSSQNFSFGKIEHAVQKAFKSTTNLFKDYERINAVRTKAVSDGNDDVISKCDAHLNAINKDISEFTTDVNKFLDYLKSSFDKINKEEIEVEEIQDIIQKELIKKNKYDVIENFILYRNKRAEVRESKSQLSKDIRKALNASDIQNQNANVDEASFGGRMGEAARVVTKDAALKMMSKKARKNHEDGWIYIHDLDSYAIGQHNCLSIPYDKLLANGFSTRQTDVRPANSVNTAFQLIAVIFQLQSLQQFGGVSATHIDWTMVPYVRKSFYKHYLNGLKYTSNWFTLLINKIKMLFM